MSSADRIFVGPTAEQSQMRSGSATFVRYMHSRSSRRANLALHVGLLLLAISLAACAEDTNSHLVAAAKHGDIAKVRALLDNGADVNSRTTLFDDTSLILAAQYGHTAVTHLLLDRGADVNAKGKGGQTALMAAARYGHTATVKILLQRGADVNTRSKDGATALSLARHERHTEIVRLLKDVGARE